MAIYIIDGKVGGGKTFWAVNHLCRKYFEYDEVCEEWLPRRNLLVVTNIDGLKLDHVDLDKEIKEHGLSGVFYCEQDVNGKWVSPYIDKLRVDYSVKNILFIIDEAQSPDKFHRKYYDEKVFIFFQMHRHFGLDIYLITQDVESLSKEIKVLPEYYIHAVNRSSAGHLSFTYKKIVNGEVHSKHKLHHDKRVFACYKSMNFDELEKPRPIYVKYVVIIGILLCIGAASAWSFAHKFWRMDKAVSSGSSFSPSLKPSFGGRPVPSFPLSSSSSPSLSSSPSPSRSIMFEEKDKTPLPVPSPVVKSPPVSVDSEFADCRQIGLIDFEGKSIKSYDCSGSIIRTVNNVVVYKKGPRHLTGVVVSQVNKPHMSPFRPSLAMTSMVRADKR